MFGSYFLVIRRKSRSSVKMKPRSTADKADGIDMTYSVITPLGNTNNLIPTISFFNQRSISKG